MKSFLVVYDYETVGVWALIRARSRAEVRKTYPILTIIEERPSWMDEEVYSRLLQTAFDVDDPPEWLALAQAERG